MMPSRISSDGCIEHVLSLQPTCKELAAFDKLHSVLFSLEDVYVQDVWPHPIVSYVQRWMHRNSLYKICPSKASSLSGLIDSIALRASLPTTDATREKLRKDCTSLILDSADKWEELGLLVQRGHSLGKHTMLKEVWASHVSRFDEFESTMFEGKSVEECSSSKKRRANFPLVHEKAKVPKANDRITQSGPSGDAKDHIVENTHPQKEPEDGSECSLIDHLQEVLSRPSQLSSMRAQRPLAPKPALTEHQRMSIAESHHSFSPELGIHHESPRQRLLLAAKHATSIDTAEAESLDGSEGSSTVINPLATPSVHSPSRSSSTMFHMIGRILVPDNLLPNTWAQFHVDVLMSRNVPEFWALFPRGDQADKVLRFDFLDIASGLESTLSNPEFIAYSHQFNFEILKKSVFQCFMTTLARHPKLQSFRIMVTPKDTPIFIMESGGKITKERGPSAQSNLSNSSSVILDSMENALVSSHQHARPSLHLVPNAALHICPAITVRIQVNGIGSFSKPFPKIVLAPKVKNVEFFAWFAEQTGCDAPIGPSELCFSFKDVVHAPKNNIIARGNEEYFEYMKRDIQPMCELSSAMIPGMFEFKIMVTVPGWEK